MAKKPIEDPDLPGDEPAIEPDEAQEPMGLELADLEAIPESQGVLWYLWRVERDADGRKQRCPQFLDKWVGRFDLIYVRDKWGGGDYEIKPFRMQDGRTPRRPDNGKRFSIAGLSKDPHAEVETVPASDALSQRLERIENALLAGHASPTSDLDGFSRMLELTRRLQPTQPDPASVMTQMLGVLQQGIELGR
jgi:hypothetical protein